MSMAALQCPKCEHEIDIGAIQIKCSQKDCGCQCWQYCQWTSILNDRSDREGNLVDRCFFPRIR